MLQIPAKAQLASSKRKAFSPVTPHEICIRLKQGEALRRTATVGGVNHENRTVQLSFSSETDTVERFYGIEILGHQPGEVDLSRLNNNAPLLWNHDWNDQRGVVERAWIGTDGIGRARVRFGNSPAAEQLFQDIRDGIVTKVSVGYSVDGLKLVEEPDDVPVYRITAWMPFEISMVSVPADDTVGVGRTLELPQQSTRAAQPLAAGQHANEGSHTNMSAFANQLRTAGPANAPTPHFDGNGRVRGVTPGSAASVATYSLRELETPSFASDPLRTVHAPTGREAGKRTALSTTILAGSRALGAGAHLVVVPAADKPVPLGNGEVGFIHRETRFECIEPSPFSRVPDGDDLDPSQAQIFRDCVDVDYMPQFGLRIPLSRADQRAYSEGQLADAVLVSIALGIARAADEVLFGSILYNTPEAFTLAKAAALGLNFGELRALVGTAGNGASVGQDGILRAAGIPAELTPATDATIVGAWNRAAIAVHESIMLTAERTNTKGDLVVTAWCNIQALLPMPGAFFTVGA